MEIKTVVEQLNSIANALGDTNPDELTTVNDALSAIETSLGGSPSEDETVSQLLEGIANAIAGGGGGGGKSPVPLFTVKLVNKSSLPYVINAEDTSVANDLYGVFSDREGTSLYISCDDVFMVNPPADTPIVAVNAEKNVYLGISWVPYYDDEWKYEKLIAFIPSSKVESITDPENVTITENNGGHLVHPIDETKSGSFTVTLKDPDE
ncbi:MAG: hypothetical protein IKD59_05395 [Lachnospiraceae bacterium]|nr:hypothetical protein [Lachnospiraceae bacterium]